MNPSLAQTPLCEWHATHGGRMVDFAGWSMPVQYSSIVAEHLATRQAAGLFDISHMGRIRFDGPGAEAFLNRMLTRDIGGMAPSQVSYSLITNEAGGILDDVLVSHLQDAGGGSYYLLVVNAGNRTKIADWLDAHRADATDCEWSDLTTSWAMIALQGPVAQALLQPLVEANLSSMSYYHAVETRLARQGAIVSRTGYTGEDGFELIVGAAMAPALWNTLVEEGTSVGLLPAGLGCRDTLRLEAGMPLYGHELNEEIDPWTAGLGFAVQLNKGDFPGRDALVRLKENQDQPKRVGLELAGKRVPREGYPLLAGDEPVGHVTSGTFSPTFEKPLAMGYVRPEFKRPGTELSVDIRGRREPARIVKLPFYRRTA